jgi:hypothetical protein
MDKGLLHCGLCEDFPCSVLDAFYNDGVKHHRLAYENMLRIKEVGLEKWVLEQEEKHTCECGKKKLWLSAKCTDEDCSL